MPQFTRRPAPVEARQFDGTADGARDLARWCNGREIAFADSSGQMVHAVSIQTVSSVRHARPGDWIVREEPGRYVVVPAAEFAETYQPVEEQAMTDSKPTPGPVDDALIAAAPELLAALRGVEPAYAALRAAGDAEETARGIAADHATAVAAFSKAAARWDAALTAARAAIAKAEGR